ncbi:MAG: M60 family metallopeptidase [Alloprevotella sp.]|nr:M60 family metallopeptidase [Alloprevotella sp.]
MKKTYRILLSLALGLLPVLHAAAQDVLPDGAAPLLLTGHNQTVGYDERTVHLDVTANVEWTYSVDADWLQTYRSVNGVYVHVPRNYVGESRSATFTFASADGHTTRSLLLTQEGFNGADDLPSDEQVKPSNVTANSSQSSNPAGNMRDGDYSTIWHTSWSGSGFNVSDSNPATITFTFSGVEQIDYVNYVPRQDNGTNGIFRRVEVLTRCQGESGYTSRGTYQWAASSAPKTVQFADGLKNPVSIQFKVYEGEGNFASCAEMEFFRRTAGSEEYDIFTDDLYAALKPGITMDDVENLSNPLVQSLAYQMLQGTYSTDYRVGTYKCYNSPQYYSAIWNAPGKYYDQVAGVTGINMTKGKYAVIVRDIPDDADVSLKVVAWYTGQESTDLNSGIGPNTSSFALHNGINVINYTYDWPGLAYICYYDQDGLSSKMAPIRVHFVNGEVNGYLSPDKTNEEMHQLTANAKNLCMDLVGEKVHSIWTADGLHRYCKDSGGSNVGYRQYINLLDTLVRWEQELLGFYKYNRVPDLRTMAYVNYTYYMFQGTFGVSFHHNTESAVLSCKNLMYDDYDKVWGLSHEWGHQHQMTPYFNWASETEVTNNMNSYYNTVHMGYTNYAHGGMPSDGLKLYNEDTSFITQRDQTTYTTVENNRKEAYDRASEYSWNTKLYNLCRSMQDDQYTATDENKYLAFSFNNYYNLRPFLGLYQYAVTKLGLTDFAQDLYEALRQTDDENGSQIEKQGAVDKYELIASAQNYNKGGKLSQLQSKFPQSTWVTSRYITTSNCNRYANSAPFIMNFIRKASRLTGYNLFPYFEKCGFLRTVAIRIYDGNWYLMTRDMYDEFEADMQALGLKTCDDAMIKAILTEPVPSIKRPTIPN